ncbi:hypothetical protein F3O63_06315 [Clostridium sp. HV4-5-A1G]|uniref:hypothetical protein n=1 Tax=Clostridium sp. HV4-5-A1G TaxID=2004595 RepID=UPI00123A5144|nr:hypothetical protein [Clostridium sp. HV4-5-A1G]KAA8674906.1 hypothetical protein F3O63_06315 [Clostridium sp. HV4-5-A1G]
MEANYISIIITIVNFALLIAIIFGIYRVIKSFKNFFIRNKEMDKKIDVILNKLDDKENKTKNF